MNTIICNQAIIAIIILCTIGFQLNDQPRKPVSARNPTSVICNIEPPH